MGKFTQKVNVFYILFERNDAVGFDWLIGWWVDGWYGDACDIIKGRTQTTLHSSFSRERWENLLSEARDWVEVALTVTDLSLDFGWPINGVGPGSERHTAIKEKGDFNGF